MGQPVQTRVPVLVQEEAEQVAVEDIVAGNEEDLGVGNKSPMKSGEENYASGL
jgi:hypothetical protein